MDSQDAERRTFHPWRALRRGIDKHGLRWALHQQLAGVPVDRLVERLGAGEAPVELAAHLRSAFVELLDSFRSIESSATFQLRRPALREHLVVGFDGDVDIENVTDSFRFDREPPKVGEARFDWIHSHPAGDSLASQHSVWLLDTARLMRRLTADLLGVAVDRVEPVVDEERTGAYYEQLEVTAIDPGGRLILTSMLAELFADEKRACDELAEQAALLVG
ncbi:MAG: hypothetical protein Q8O67_34125 [Deltaproteobacteria bacterium]|nr:hypothetical protein [Deltaproteobacteria bacterium]